MKLTDVSQKLSRVSDQMAALASLLTRGNMHTQATQVREMTQEIRDSVDYLKGLEDPTEVEDPQVAPDSDPDRPVHMGVDMASGKDLSVEVTVGEEATPPATDLPVPEPVSSGPAEEVPVGIPAGSGPGEPLAEATAGSPPATPEEKPVETYPNCRCGHPADRHHAGGCGDCDCKGFEVPVLPSSSSEPAPAPHDEIL